MALLHAVPVTDVLEAGHLVRGPARARRMGAARVPAYAVTVTSDVPRATWVQDSYLRRFLGRHDACAPCLAGQPCAAWDTVEFGAHTDHGYALRAPEGAYDATANDDAAREAAVLGIAWPATAAEVRRAFSTKLQASHPDHGGSPATTRALVAARDALLARLPKETTP